MNDIAAAPHQISRIRREVRRRHVTVAAVEALTPGMRRIHFASPELHDFASDAHDDHVKLFLPAPPQPGHSGPQEAEVCKRDYTPRAFDPRAGTLVIDFVLHHGGPATAWARAAQPGDRLEIGGPRGSVIVPDDFDWYLLIGDETALPAIGRRLESLRAGPPVTTLVVLNADADRQSFNTRAAWTPLWSLRGAETLDALLCRTRAAYQALPAGDGHVWIAAEAGLARALRDHVIDDLGHPRAWVKAAGYWTAGQADAPATLPG